MSKLGKGGVDDWMSQALCRGTAGPNNIFFSESTKDKREAKTICQSCPVRQDCLATALKQNGNHGIWAGLDENELKKIYKLQRKTSQSA